MTAIEKMERLVEIDRSKTANGKEKVALGSERKVLEDELKDYFCEEGVNERFTPDGAKLRLTTKMTLSVADEREQEAMQWLKDNGLGVYVEPKISNKFATYVNDMEQTGCPMPDIKRFTELFKPFPLVQIKVTGK